MASSPLLAFAACLSPLLSFCGGSGAGAADSSALQTDSYLGDALDSNYIFHWTPRTVGEVTEIFVEVQNAPGELPEALKRLNYGPAECAAAVRSGFESWTQHSGVPMKLGLAFHDRGETLGADVVKIEVSFHASTEPGLVGYTQVETLLLQPALVQRVTVEIRIGPELGVVTGEMVYALLLHEFGHALGIVAPAPHTGHSDRASDVMFPHVRWSELSKDDRLALRELYTLRPTMWRADETSNGPGGGSEPGDEGDGLGSWIRRLNFFGRELRSEPARPAAPESAEAEAPALLRCGSCAR